MKRGRPKGSKTDKTKKRYWDDTINQAIIDYNALEPSSSRDRLFVGTLYRPIKKLSQEVLKYVSYTKNLSLDSEEFNDWITDSITNTAINLHHYRDVSRSSFSYFQTATKNFYLEKIRKMILDQRNIPLEGNTENEDEDGLVANTKDSLVYENPEHILDEYRQAMIEYISKKIKKINRYKNVNINHDDDENIVLSTILKYLFTEPILDVHALRLFIVHELIDTKIVNEWKIDRVLHNHDIRFVAVLDKTDFTATVKYDNLSSDNWGWIDDAYKMDLEPARIRNQATKNRLSYRNKTDEEKEILKEKKKSYITTERRIEIKKRHAEYKKEIARIDKEEKAKEKLKAKENKSNRPVSDGLGQSIQ